MEVDYLNVFESIRKCSAVAIAVLNGEKGLGIGVLQEGKKIEKPLTCDYTNGEWVEDDKSPLYDCTSCGTIKDGQNCLSHGRSDTGYIYWRWKPRQCDLSRFDPQFFLEMIEGKDLPLVGDSMGTLGRKQLESFGVVLHVIVSFSA